VFLRNVGELTDSHHRRLLLTVNAIKTSNPTNLQMSEAKALAMNRMDISIFFIIFRQGRRKVNGTS
jgi:hypothetical protein